MGFEYLKRKLFIKSTDISTECSDFTDNNQVLLYQDINLIIEKAVNKYNYNY